MSLACKIGIHSWKNDCEKCSKCGKTRTEQHDYTFNCRVCSKCYKASKNKHAWSSESDNCSNCSQTKKDVEMEIHRYYYLTVKSHSLSAIRSSIYDTTSIFGQPINKNKIENDAFKSASYQVCEKYDITEKKLLVILKKGKSQKWDTD